MAHAPTDTTPKPRRRRNAPPPPPPHQHAPSDQPTSGPSVPPPRVHGSYEPAPLHGSAHPQLDQILRLGAGPLRLPPGKLNLPARRAPAFSVPPPLAMPARGEPNVNGPLYQNLFGQKPTRVPPDVQTMLEHATHAHTPEEAQYVLGAVDLADLNKRADELGVVDNTPLGDFVRSVNSAVGDPTNRIHGFPETGRTAVPPLYRAILEDRVRQMAGGAHDLLPKNPTDAQLVEAAFGSPHHNSYWDALYNLPRDIAETPLYALEGTAALGSATAQAALHGNTDPLREIAAEQLATVKHPGAFIQQHPAQALLAGGAIASRLGALSAAARGATLEQRLVPTRYGSTVDRGVSPPNDYVRSIQGIQDYLTRPHAGVVARVPGAEAFASRLQDMGLKKNIRQVDRNLRNAATVDEQVLIQRVNKAAGKLSRAQQERVLANEAMGPTPQQMASFHGREPSTTAPLSAAQREYLDALTAYRHFSEQQMQGMGHLGEGAALHRSVDPVAQVRAMHGDQAAQDYLEVNAEIDQLQHRMELLKERRRRLGNPFEREFQLQNRILEGQLHQAFADRNQYLSTIQTRHVAEGGAAPIRVPLRQADQRVGLFSNRGGGGPGAVKRRGQRRYTGSLFASGQYEAPTHVEMMRDIQQPLNAQSYHRLANHVLDPTNGVAVPAEPGAPVPEDMVLVQPAQRVPPNQELQSVLPGESIFKRLDFHASAVPLGEGYALLPRVVAQEIYDRGKNIGKGRPGGRVSQGLRNVLLYSRPSYPLTNLFGNIQQGMLENVGPLSYGRALERGGRKLPVPTSVTEGGAVRSSFSPLGETLGDKLAGASLPRQAATLIGHPLSAYTRSMYTAARVVEDATRRAAYFKRAVPAARDIAHADRSAVSRFLMSFREVDAKTRAVLDQMATGTGDAHVQLAARDAVEAVNRVLGDFAAIPSNAAFDIAAPFHRWAQFATRLLVVTLPLHYPGKALLLYRLGALGEQAQTQMGPLTPSLQGMVPLGNNPQDIIALNTQYPNTFATLGGALAADQRGSSNVFGLNPASAASYVSPLARLALTAFTGIDPTTGFTLTNQKGEGVLHSDRDHPPDPNATSDYLRLIAAQGLGLVPPLRTFFQPPNAPDTSIPLPWLAQGPPGSKLPAWAQQLPGAQKPQTNLQLTAMQELYNFFSPFKARRINLQLLAQQGVNDIAQRIAATQRKEFTP